MGALRGALVGALWGALVGAVVAPTDRAEGICLPGSGRSCLVLAHRFG